jgi:hypothetical protein
VDGGEHVWMGQAGRWECEQAGGHATQGCTCTQNGKSKQKGTTHLLPILASCRVTADASTSPHKGVGIGMGPVEFDK